jgi:hypothetical protein
MAAEFVDAAVVAELPWKPRWALPVNLNNSTARYQRGRLSLLAQRRPDNNKNKRERNSFHTGYSLLLSERHSRIHGSPSAADHQPIEGGIAKDESYKGPAGEKRLWLAAIMIVSMALCNICLRVSHYRSTHLVAPFGTILAPSPP